MRVALVYSKTARTPLRSMDMIRWASLGRALARHGAQVDLVTARPDGVEVIDGIPVRAADGAPWPEYDLVKVCYQTSLGLVPDHPAICARMCRVVDEHLPRRDDGRRAEMIALQAEIAERARWVAFNDEINARRWLVHHGTRQRTVLTPTGCPEEIPPPGPSPLPAGPPVLLHCGSLTSVRLLEALGRLADAIDRAGLDVRVAHLGRNRLHLYGGAGLRIDPRVLDLGETDVDRTWSYLDHAAVGLALAPSEHPFESELSKIYYYLRAGLPVVTEDSVPNRGLVEATGHGAIARYDDPESWIASIVRALALPRRHAPAREHMVARHGWDSRARTYLDLIAPAEPPWGVIRIDDVVALDEPLLSVWDILEERGIPIHLEVVPEGVSADEARRIETRARGSKVPVAVHQHGYRHADHGGGGRRHEFGEGRDPGVQREEVERGAERLEELFPTRFQRFFSAPWNRLDEGTVRALAASEFVGYSTPRSRHGLPVAERLAWVPMTVDPVDWRPTPRPWPRERLAAGLRDSAAQYGQVGVLLHPAVIDDGARAALAGALDEVRGRVRWTTMRDAASRASR